MHQKFETKSYFRRHPGERTMGNDPPEGVVLHALGETASANVIPKINFDSSDCTDIAFPPKEATSRRKFSNACSIQSTEDIYKHSGLLPTANVWIAPAISETSSLQIA